MAAYTFHVDFDADDDTRAVRVGEVLYSLLVAQEPIRPGGWDVSGADGGRRDWSLILTRSTIHRGCE